MYIATIAANDNEKTDKNKSLSIIYIYTIDTFGSKLTKTVL